MRNTRLEIRLLSAPAAPRSPASTWRRTSTTARREIRDALNEHCVVFFRDRSSTGAPESLRPPLGEIFVHPNYVA